MFLVSLEYYLLIYGEQLEFYNDQIQLLRQLKLLACLSDIGRPIRRRRLLGFVVYIQIVPGLPKRSLLILRTGCSCCLSSGAQHCWFSTSRNAGSVPQEMLVQYLKKCQFSTSRNASLVPQEVLVQYFKKCWFSASRNAGSVPQEMLFQYLKKCQFSTSRNSSLVPQEVLVQYLKKKEMLASLLQV